MPLTLDNNCEIEDNGSLNVNIKEDDQQKLVPYQYTEYNMYDVDSEIDPDNNFFTAIKNNCGYYSNEHFNEKIKLNGAFSIIHFNSRSLYTNFNYIKNYLHVFRHAFDIIAVTETWINTEKENNFELEGYSFVNVNQQNKVGGGVGIFVKDALKFRVIDGMSAVIDNILECLTIEIYYKEKKNVMISCVYRTPGSNVELFSDWMEETFAKMSHKTTYICGDFNVDLLSSENHKTTEDFINTMYSMSF